MNKSQKGNVSEAQILAALVKLGKRICVPFGDYGRYDLVLDENNVFSRVQVKTGRLVKGVITFLTASKSTCKDKKNWNGYDGEVEYFGVYCPQIDKCYLVPIDDTAKYAGRLRVEPFKTKRVYKCLWAKDFEL